jgi:uncharacterized membrane-anchored protein YjiN (DUF445 family)
MNKKQLMVVLWVMVIFVFSCCLFITTNAYAEFNYHGYEQGGLWGGLWDGVKSIVTIPLNVIWGNTNVYNVNNNGFAYNFGFFALAFAEFAVTVWLFIIAWIIKIVFIFLIMIIALIFRK